MQGLSGARRPPENACMCQSCEVLEKELQTLQSQIDAASKEDTEASKEEAKKTFVTLKPARQYRFH